MSPSATSPSRLDIAALQPEYGGSWVALARGEVVEARHNPYELVQALHERGLSGTMIVRVPAVDEPETIGMG